MFKLPWHRKQERPSEDTGRNSEQILADCKKELCRIEPEPYGAVSRPRDIERRARILSDASRVGLGSSMEIRQLDYLHRLLNALREGGVDYSSLGPFIYEANTLDLSGYYCVSFVDFKWRLALLESGTPVAIERPEGMSAVYWRGHAYYRRRRGVLEIRENGVGFTGEIVYQVLWEDAVHVSETTRPVDGQECDAIAVQENGRKTASVFILTPHVSNEYACVLARRLWEAERA